MNPGPKPYPPTPQGSTPPAAPAADGRGRVDFGPAVYWGGHQFLARAADGFARAAARGLLGREPLEKLGERFPEPRAENDVAFVDAQRLVLETELDGLALGVVGLAEGEPTSAAEGDLGGDQLLLGGAMGVDVPAVGDRQAEPQRRGIRAGFDDLGLV